MRRMYKRGDGTVAQIAELFGAQFNTTYRAIHGLSYAVVDATEAPARMDRRTPLTAEIVAEMRRASKQGMLNREIARICGVTQSCVSNAVTGRTWRSADALEPPRPKR